MLTLVRRLASLAAILALSVGNLATCAGWESTPEARMACCMDDDVCPMQPSESHDSGAANTVSQSQADSCCAASEGHESATSSPTPALSTTLAVAASPLPAVLPAFHSALDGRRALVLVPPSPVPKHLLLSVFLV